MAANLLADSQPMANLDHVAYDAPPEDADRLRMLGKGDLAVVPMVVDDRGS
jgi:hypothetical protein